MTNPGNHNQKSAFRLLLVVLAAAVLATAVSAPVWMSGQSGTSLADSTSPFEVPHERPSDEFATSDSCRSCHPGEYASWHHSYHRTMAQLATPDAIAAPFDEVELQDEALTCRLERRGDEFWATVFETNWRQRYLDAGIQPESVIGTARSPFLKRRIELVTGSHHMQVYWVANGGRMLELPFYYHIDGKRWIPRDDSVLAPPQKADAAVSSAEWRQDCVKCHSLGGNPRLRPEDGRFETTVAEFGISCEACHGPAAEHIQYHRNPLNRYRRHLNDDEQGDPTIVNPARLSHTASSQVCGQCHISFLPRDVDDFYANGLRYRAGRNLEDSHVIQQFDEKAGATGGLTTYWRDGTCCVGGDEYLGLRMSRCFLDGEMSCLSCHSMHDSDPSDQLARHMDTDHACLQCHQTYADNVEAHTHHPAASSGSRCYNCHMPHTTYALFTAMRSHRVDSPDISSSSKSGRPNACNLCHLDQTLRWSAEHLNAWFGTPVPQLSADETTIAASVLWMLKGNAVQRLVTAWHVGWGPAQDASGTGWQIPFLAQLLEDPYAMVRYTAHTALGNLPGFGDFSFDYVAPSASRTAAHQEALRLWRHRKTGVASGALLLNGPGDPDMEEIERLLNERDDTPIVISE